MSDDIAPALTPEEWHSLTSDHGACVDCYAQNYRIVRTVDDDETPIPLAEVLYPKDVSRHALAALCLHGQPFGFTHDDVDALRYAAKALVDYERPLGGGDDNDDARYLRDLADRLAALLPPRST